MVTGNVSVDQGAILSTDGGVTIAGNVRANQCDHLNLQHVLIEGNVLIQNCTASSLISAIESGPIQVNGNLICSNDSCEVVLITVGGNVILTENTTLIPSSVADNTIGGNLICEGNTLPLVPPFRANMVAGNKIGQCDASLGF
jgi:formylmethanofuran dehydrogenase subunit C